MALSILEDRLSLDIYPAPDDFSIGIELTPAEEKLGAGMPAPRKSVVRMNDLGSKGRKRAIEEIKRKLRK